MSPSPPRLPLFPFLLFFFFFNDTATTEIYTLSLHDALPIYLVGCFIGRAGLHPQLQGYQGDRKSTRLNSSHGSISYAVFCLKKTKNTHKSPYYALYPAPPSASATRPAAD